MTDRKQLSMTGVGHVHAGRQRKAVGLPNPERDKQTVT